MAIDGGSVEVRFEGDVTPLRRSVEEAVEEVSKLEVAAQKVDEALGKDFGSEALKGFDNFSSKAGDAFGAFVDKADQSVLSLKSLGQSLKGIGLATFTAGVGTATGALMNLAQKGIQATDFLETSRVAMAGLTGSMAEGNKAMTEAAKYWQNNPFQRIDVTNATKQLVQFGRTTDQISGDLEILGNVSLSTGMDIDQLARYYARVSASGRAMTIDLEMMSDRGVPIYRELGKQLGATTAEVRKMASEGKIDFETFRKAMEGAVNAEAMEAYENTLARQTDRLKGSISSLAGELAGYKIINDELVISEDGLEKAWMRLVKTTATALRSDELKAGMEGLGQALAKVVDKITTLVEPAINMLSKAVKFLGENSSLLLPLLGALAVGIGKLGSSIPIVSSIMAQLGGGKLGGIIGNIKEFIRLNPLLTAAIGILGLGFFNAMKNSEEFRNTMGSILSSLATIAKNLWEAFEGVFNVIVQIVQSLANSGAVQGILQGIASALAWIAQAVASIPPEALATLISFFVSLKLLKANPLYLLAAGLALLIGKIKELGGITKIFENLPETLGTIGHNLMTGLVNGIQEGAKKVFEYVKGIARTIVSTFKNMLGIHSPSTVMYGLGEDVVLGLANGIEDNSSAVQVAMNNLAKDILSLSEKVIKNKVDFGILDIKGQYQEWKKVSRMFAVGSEQYNAAVEKMEEARKQANLQILSLQQAYNDALDETIDRIANMYGLLDDVNLKAGKNASQILKGLDQQVAKLSEWAEAQDKIAQTGLDAKLIEELQGMGVDATSELSAIANMTSDELSTLNDMWLKKQSIANKAGVKQMEGLKKDTLEQINDLKNGIDGATVDVEDVGGRLVSSISEGVYGAMPTLKSAFDQLGSYIEKAQKELAKSASGGTAGVDTGGVSTDVPNAGDEIAKTLKEEVENGLGKLKDMLPNVILGGIAAWGVLKFGPKIASALAKKLVGGDKLFTQALGGLIQEGLAGSLKKTNLSAALGTIDIKRDGGFLSKAIGKLQGKLEGDSAQVAQEVSKTSQNVTKMTKPAENIAQGSTSFGQSMTTASKGMTTASKGLTKINSILGTITRGAVAVIAIAAAVIAMAAALRGAYELLKGIDFGRFQLVLVEMFEAIAVFGTASFVLGQIPVVTLIKGIVAVIGIAAEVALLGLAIGTAYTVMKDIDFEKYQVILLEMIEALGVMGGFSTLFGVLMPLVGLGWVSIIAICDELVKVSDALYKVYTTVPDDFDKVIKKIELIKKVLNKVVDTDLGTLIGSIVASWEVGPLTRIMDMYTRVAQELEKISSLTLDPDKINASMELLQTTLEGVKSKTNFIAGWLQAWADEAQASSVESAGRVVITYGQVVDALNKLADFKPDNAKIMAGITAVAAVVERVRNSITRRGGLFNLFGNDVAGFASDVDNIKEILKNYLEMVPTFQDLGETKNKITNTVRDAVTTNVGNIKDIVKEIGSVDTGGWIEQKENDIRLIQSIINKFTEIIPVAEQVRNISLDKEDIIKKIKDVKDVIKEIGSVNKGQNIADKEWAVGMATSIAHKFVEFDEVLSLLSGQDHTGAINSVTGSMNALLDGVVTNMNSKIVAFENVGVNMGQALAKGVRSQTASAAEAGIALQASLWRAIEDRMGDEWHQGEWMATQFGNGLKSVSFENIGAQMQTSLWWGIQNRMQDEYYQGRAMGERFRQGLYDVDYGNAGWWAVQGFINGAWGRAGSGDGVYHTGWWIANNFLQGLKDRGGQGSPWKTTMQSGEWAIEGLIDGMKDQEAALVGEATSLADQVIDALTMDNLTMSPTLDASVAPSMGEGEYGIVGGNGREVTINQTNEVYTEVDMENINRSLAWDISKA